jgi:hypothetical protein
MKRALLVLLPLTVPLVLASATARAVDGGYKPCSLLKLEEVETTLGTKVLKSHEADTPYQKDATHDQAGVYSTCSWTLDGRSMLLAISTAALTEQSRQRGLKAKSDSEDALKKQGIRVEKKKLGAIDCTMISPPQGKTIPRGTTCSGEKGKLVYYLSISSKKELPPVPMERLKSLAEKAASRMP